MSKNGKKRAKLKAQSAWSNKAEDIQDVKDPTKPLKKMEHELFCTLYSCPADDAAMSISKQTFSNFFGNAQNCYVYAYGYAPELHDIDMRLELEQNQSIRKRLSQRRKSILLTGRVNGHNLLTNTNIRQRCDHLLDQFISNEMMDRELAYTALQRYDLRSKVDAIKEYNRVRDRVSDKVSGNLTISWEETPNASKKPLPVKAK